METYIVRVNGITYEVEVEKKGEHAGAPAQAPQAAAPVQTVSAAQPAGQATQAPAEGDPVTTGTAGKVWKVVAQPGAQMKRGDAIVILEAMKMEIPVVAPHDGVVTSICVKEGDSVESGQTIATVR